MVGRRLYTKEHEASMKRMHNSDDEDYILRRFPFHEARSKFELMRTYTLAIDLVFSEVPMDRWDGVMGRLNRKLVKQRKVLEGIR